MFQEILTFIEHLNSWYIAGFVFFSAFTENVFPPYPGDTVIVFGGYLAGKGTLPFWLAALSSYLGSMLGALVMYFGGEKLLQIFQEKFGHYSWAEFLNEKNLQKSHEWMEKYGAWIVIFSRFSAGIRFFVAIVAGMIRMNLLLFFATFSIATALWNFLLMYLAFQVGENWQRVLEFVRVYNFIIFGIIFLLVGIWAIYKVRKEKTN